MKSTIRITASVLTLTVVYFLCSAHFPWTETAGIATLGKEHLVNVFFGEVNFRQFEVAGGRLDEMDGLNTVVITPKNEIKPLTLEKQKDRFITKFTPAEVGIYQVLATNEVAKVMDLRKSQLGIVKPMYYTRQIVSCPDKTAIDPAKNATFKPYFELDLIPVLSNAVNNTFKVNTQVDFYSYFKKTAIKGGKIYVHAPNGWSKEVDADENGLCSFTPLWEGQYVIDWVYTENSPGTYNNKFFESFRHRAILTLHVVK